MFSCLLSPTSVSFSLQGGLLSRCCSAVVLDSCCWAWTGGLRSARSAGGEMKCLGALCTGVGLTLLPIQCSLEPAGDNQDCFFNHCTPGCEICWKSCRDADLLGVLLAETQALVPRTLGGFSFLSDKVTDLHHIKADRSKPDAPARASNVSATIPCLFTRVRSWGCVQSCPAGTLGMGCLVQQCLLSPLLSSSLVRPLPFHLFWFPLCFYLSFFPLLRLLFHHVRGLLLLPIGCESVVICI